MHKPAESLILSSACPDDAFFDALASQLNSLKPSERAVKLNSWEPELVGSLDDVVREMRQVVEKDRLGNISKCLPCSFEYQLVRLSNPMDHVALWTRLFKPPEPQSIFYGQEVARINEALFAAWISD